MERIAPDLSKAGVVGVEAIERHCHTIDLRLPRKPLVGVQLDAAGVAIAPVVVGGQSLCLFLTLLLIPVVYVQFAGLEDTIVNRRWKRFISQFRPLRWFRPATAE